MSRYLADSGTNMQQVASTSGWGQYIEWVESVSPEDDDDFLPLHLVEHGYAEPVSELRDSLATLPAPEDANVKDVHLHVIGFVNTLADDEVVLVSD